LRDINPKDFPEEFGRILGSIARIPSASSITESQIEHVIRPKDNHAAVVVRKGLIGRNDDAICRGQGDIRIHWIHEVAGHDRHTGNIGVTHIETAVGRILRIKRQPEQSLLTAGGNQSCQIEKCTDERIRGSIKDPDEAALFHDEEARIVARGSG
jgi:hypothetical protein